MKTLVCSIALAAVTTLATAQSYVATLDAGQNGGGGRTGDGIFLLTLTENVMTITGDFSGLSGVTVNAHIHGPSGIGMNSGVLYELLNQITLGADNKSGSINTTIPLIANPNNTTFDIPAQIEQLNSGLWYFNVHSSTFPGGEIRGQILAVPEPSTIALSAVGFAGLLIWQLRRRLS